MIRGRRRKTGRRRNKEREVNIAGHDCSVDAG